MDWTEKMCQVLLSCLHATCQVRFLEVQPEECRRNCFMPTMVLSLDTRQGSAWGITYSPFLEVITFLQVALRPQSALRMLYQMCRYQSCEWMISGGEATDIRWQCQEQFLSLHCNKTWNSTIRWWWTAQKLEAKFSRLFVTIYFAWSAASFSSILKPNI